VQSLYPTTTLRVFKWDEKGSTYEATIDSQYNRGHLA